MGYETIVRDISQYNVPGITEQTREILAFISRELIKEYEKLDRVYYNQFDGLKKIVWTTKNEEIPCPGAIGCAELSPTGGAVYSLFYDDHRFNAAIMSMEDAHYAILGHCHDYGITGPNGENKFELSNDLIHRAANGMEPRYVSWIKTYFKSGSIWDSLRNFFLPREERVKRAMVQVNLFVYNLKNIMEDKDKLMNEIRNGTAPTGIHEYWAGIEDSPAKKQILDWMHSYESAPHHH